MDLPSYAFSSVHFIPPTIPIPDTQIQEFTLSKDVYLWFTTAKNMQSSF